MSLNVKLFSKIAKYATQAVHGNVHKKKLVKIEARILIFPGTDFHFPSTSVPPGTFFRLCSV